MYARRQWVDGRGWVFTSAPRCRVCDLFIPGHEPIVRSTSQTTMDESHYRDDDIEAITWGPRMDVRREWRNRQAEANAYVDDEHDDMEAPGSWSLATLEYRGTIERRERPRATIEQDDGTLMMNVARHCLAIAKSSLITANTKGREDWPLSFEEHADRRVGYTGAEVRDAVQRLCDTSEITASLQNILEHVQARGWREAMNASYQQCPATDEDADLPEETDVPPSSTRPAPRPLR